MIHEPQAVLDCLLEFVQKMKIARVIEGVIYREGYEDYQVIMENGYHCELREKLVDTLITNPNHGDTKREIAYLLNSSSQFEDWEQDIGIDKTQNAIDIDLSDL